MHLCTWIPFWHVFITVFKYKKVSDESFGDKLAKLSFHTIKKKGSRFKGRISTNLGLSLVSPRNNCS